jgi:hypothetical protein
MYPFLKRHKIFGFNLKPNIEINSNKQINPDRSFKHYLRNDIIKFQTDNVGFLKPINEYKNTDGTFFFFGGSTTFGTEIDQQDSWVEFALKKQEGNKIFNYKNYSIPGYCSNNDLALIKELKKNSKLENKILVFSHGWNEEFHSSTNRDNPRNINLVCNEIENNFIYCKSSFFTFLLSNYKFLRKIIKYFFDLRFKRLMNFSNPSRWKSLSEGEYVDFWISNLNKIFKNLADENFPIFIMNGGLCYLSDKEKDKLNIINNSRISENYFNYQALCIAINNITINTISELFNIPVIDFCKIFQNMESKERLKYFIDDIHYNAEGNHLCGEEFKKQIKYLNFKETKKIKKFDIDKLNSTLKKRLDYLFELARIKSLKLKKIDNFETNIPKDRYPLW